MTCMTGLHGANVDAFYDREKHRFKGSLFPIALFLVGLIIVFAFGFLTNSDYLALFSYIMFVLAIVSLVHDHWIMNSLVAPMWFLFVVTTILDISTSSVFTGIIHGTTTVACVIAVSRHDVSFCLESLASTFYGIYIYMVNYWGSVYTCGFWVCNAAIEGVMIFGMGFITALASLTMNWLYKKKGGAFDCDGGFCPL